MATNLTPMQKELLGEAALIATGTAAAVLLTLSALCAALYGVFRLITLLPRRDPCGSFAALVMVLLLIYAC